MGMLREFCESGEMIGRPPATTHWAIRDTAIQLFIRNGYAETSLAAIAAECGISRTTLFAYFRAKADILLYGDERNIERLLLILDNAPPDVSVGSVVRRAARTMRTLPWNVRELLVQYWRIVDENDDVAAKAARISSRYGIEIAGFVRRRLLIDESDPMPAVLGETISAAMRAGARHWTEYPQEGLTLDAAVVNAVTPVVTLFLGDR